MTPTTDLIRSFYRDVDAGVDLEPWFGPGFRDHNRPAAAPQGVPDRTVILDLLAQLRTGFPDGRHALRILAAVDADRAMVLWRFEGTHRGPFFGHPASAAKVRIDGVDIFRGDGERLTEQWHVEELMTLFSQIAAPVDAQARDA